MIDPFAFKLQRYTLTAEQLQTYLQIVSGDNSVRVVAGALPATHGAGQKNSVVQLPVGSPVANIAASHEAFHVAETRVTEKAIYDVYGRRYLEDAEQAVLNAIEDGRLERQRADQMRTEGRPGYRPQFQELIDAYAPVIQQEEWTLQALKGIYVRVAGYRFDESKLDPKAQNVLNRTVSFISPIRKVTSTDGLIPFIPKILALFDEMPQMPNAPQMQSPAAAGHQHLVIDPNEGDLGGNITMPGEECGPDCQYYRPGGDTVPKQGMPGQGQPSNQPGQGQGQPGQGGRNAITYNASAPRLNTGKGGGGSGSVKGHDRATGGPDANALMRQGSEIAQKVRGMEQRIKASLAKPEPASYGSPVLGGDDKTASRAQALPKSMRNVAGIDNGGGQVLTNLGDIYGAGLSYTPGPYSFNDARNAASLTPEAIRSHELATEYNASARYLAQQLRVFLQTTDQTGKRDHETAGLIDPRRLHAIATGKLDIFRRPPNRRDVRPVVVLTTDLSSSMFERVQRDDLYHGKDVHALAATLMMAKALDFLRIPFEVHGFETHGWLIKTFNDRFNDQTITNAGWLIKRKGGGTHAGEAMSLAWARAVARPEPRKIVIQVTDGDVSDNVRKMAERIEQQGGICMAVGIGHGVTRDRYLRYVEVDHPSELPGTFARLLKKLLPTGRWA